MEHIRKPEWLKIQIGANARYADTKRIVDTHKLHTICSSGRCPNLGECWELSVPVHASSAIHKAGNRFRLIRKSLGT